MANRIVTADEAISSLIHGRFRRRRALVDQIGNSLDLILWCSYRLLRYVIVPVLVLLIAGGRGPIAAAIIVNLFGPGSPSALPFRLLLGSALGFLVEIAIKSRIRRARPASDSAGAAAHRVHKHEQYSFPSGHSMRAGLALVTIIDHFPRDGVVIVGASAWAMAIVLARVVSGRHYLGDTVIGAIFGAILGWALGSLDLFGIAIGSIVKLVS